MAWKRRSIFAAVIVTALPAAAGTWYVDDCAGAGGDGASASTPFCGIQRGLDAAVEGDTVRVLPGTYRGCVVAPYRVQLVADDYVLNGDRTTTILDGTDICDTAAAPRPTVILGNGGTLEGFTVRGGGASGVLAFGAVVITKNVIEGNAATSQAAPYPAFGGRGGGVMVYTTPFYASPTEARIEDNVVRNNHAEVSGGGIFVLGGSTDTVARQVRVEGNQVTDNSALESGGGIGVFIDTQAGEQVEVAITSNTIEGNSATGATAYDGYGGGVYATTFGEGSETIRIEGNTARLNTASYGGGGIAAWVQEQDQGLPRMFVQGNDVSANFAGVEGGGMDLVLRAVEVPSTSAPQFTVRGNRIRENHALHSGGGASILATADASSGTRAVTTLVGFWNNLVTGNEAAGPTADASGGGVSVGLVAWGNAVAGTAFNWNTLASNRADIGGGGIDVWIDTDFGVWSPDEGLASVVVEGSIITDNVGFGIGKAPPGIWSTDNLQAAIHHNDVFGNLSGPYEDTIGPPPADSHNLEVDPLLDASFVPSVCSPTIDAADTIDDYAQEPQPNGARTNQGHLGETGSATTSLPDPNGDRLVDGVDVLRIASAFASIVAGPRYYAPADLDGNGVVDGDDLAYVAARFGTDCR